MVRKHFEVHTQLVARRVVGRQLRRLEKLSKIVDEEVVAQLASGGRDNGELVDTKVVNKACNLAKTVMYMVRDFNTYQREDMRQTGISNLWRSVDLGATSVTEAKQLLDRAAMVQSAAGAGDRPTASELFGD